LDDLLATPPTVSKQQILRTESLKLSTVDPYYQVVLTASKRQKYFFK